MDKNAQGNRPADLRAAINRVGPDDGWFIPARSARSLCLRDLYMVRLNPSFRALVARFDGKSDVTVLAELMTTGITASQHPPKGTPE